MGVDAGNDFASSGLAQTKGDRAAQRGRNPREFSGDAVDEVHHPGFLKFAVPQRHVLREQHTAVVACDRKPDESPPLSFHKLGEQLHVRGVSLRLAGVVARILNPEDTAPAEVAVENPQPARSLRMRRKGRIWLKLHREAREADSADDDLFAGIRLGVCGREACNSRPHENHHRPIF